MNKSNHKHIWIIGGGAAGLMFAIQAAERGLDVGIIDGQAVLGAKILMSGGGRCNVTNSRITPQDYSSSALRIVDHVLRSFSSKDAIDFFHSRGAPLKKEGTQFFSADNNAKSILRALLSSLKKQKIRIELSTKVAEIKSSFSGFEIFTSRGVFTADYVVVATGGLSYPKTGSDGSGLKILESLGHTIIEPKPSLTPMLLGQRSKFFTKLSGVAVKCALSLWQGQKRVHLEEGDLLFAHFGMTGPATLNMSRFWARMSNAPGLRLTIDFLPQYPANELPDFGQQTLKNALANFLPQSLAVTLSEEMGVDGGVKATTLIVSKKKILIEFLRQHPLDVTGVMGFDKAEVTSGGVDLKDVKGASLESRIVPGLFFVGEVLDVDGRIGGYNFHWAWASAKSALQGLMKKII